MRNRGRPGVTPIGQDPPPSPVPPFPEPPPLPDEPPPPPPEPPLPEPPPLPPEPPLPEPPALASPPRGAVLGSPFHVDIHPARRDPKNAAPPCGGTFARIRGIQMGGSKPAATSGLPAWLLLAEAGRDCSWDRHNWPSPSSSASASSNSTIWSHRFRPGTVVRHRSASVASRDHPDPVGAHPGLSSQREPTHKCRHGHVEDRPSSRSGRSQPSRRMSPHGRRPHGGPRHAE
jgi:hypothetical protein